MRGGGGAKLSILKYGSFLGSEPANKRSLLSGNDPPQGEGEEGLAPKIRRAPRWKNCERGKKPKWNFFWRKTKLHSRAGSLIRRPPTHYSFNAKARKTKLYPQLLKVAKDLFKSGGASYFEIKATPPGKAERE